MADDLSINARLIIPGRALTVKTSRASGPGGQHVNRTESKVLLRLDLAAVEWLDERTRERVLALSGRNVDQHGAVFVVSQEHRDQSQNLESARAKLRELIAKALVRPKKRVATKPTRASKQRRLTAKKHASDTKAQRRKVEHD